MAYCAIRKNSKGTGVERASLRNGATSTIFDKIAGIPVLKDKVKAIAAYLNIYSSKFKKKFGDWEKNIPLNKRAVAAIMRKARSHFDEATQRKIERYSNSLTNPVMVERLTRQDPVTNENYEYYTTEITGQGDVFIIDDLSERMVDATTNNGSGEAMALKSPVATIKTENGDVVAVHKNFYKQDVATITEEDTQSMFVTDRGEPRVFFISPSNYAYDTYEEALKNTQSGDIRIGFLAGTSEKISGNELPGVADVTIRGNEIKINNNDAIYEVAKANSLSDMNSRNGYLNYLIRKGVLSGQMERNKDGEYCYKGQGASEGLIAYNTTIAYDMLANKFGKRNVTQTEEGLIQVKETDPNKIEVIEKGVRKSVTRQYIYDKLEEGRYEELRKEIPDIDAIMMSLLPSVDMFESSEIQDFIKSVKEQGVANKLAILDILKTLGVNVMGMSDYLERYTTLNGAEINEKALADVANGVIAIAEGANIDDLVEEVAHFLVETYENQGEIDEVLDSVVGTDEWNAHAAEYRELYRKQESDEKALDRLVKKEVLGKLLRDHIMNATRKDPLVYEETSSLFNLAKRIVDWLKSNFTTQRKDYKNLIERIAPSGIIADSSKFSMANIKNAQYVMFSRSDDVLGKKLASQLTNLERQRRNFARMRNGLENSVEYTAEQTRKIRDEIEQQMRNHTNAIDRINMIKTVEAYLATLQSEINYLAIKINSGVKITMEDMAVLDSARDMANVLNEIKAPLNERDLENQDLKSERERITRNIESSIDQLNQIDGKMKLSRANVAEDMIDKIADRWNVPPRYRDTVKSMFKSVQDDVWALTKWIGTLQNRSNPVLSFLNKIVSNTHTQARTVARDMTDPFIRAAEAGRWKANEWNTLVKKRADGSSTSYYESLYNEAQFSDDMNTEQLSALIDIYRGYEAKPDRNHPTRWKPNEELAADFARDKEAMLKQARGKGIRIFVGERMNSEGEMTERYILFKTHSTRLFRDSDMSELEIQDFKDRMELWMNGDGTLAHPAHVERRYTDAYYQQLDNEMQLALGEAKNYLLTHYGIDLDDFTEEAKLFMNNVRAQMTEIRERHKDASGKVDWFELINSTDGMTYNYLTKEKRKMMSEFDPLTGTTKSPQDLKNAISLKYMNQAWSNMFAARQQTDVIAELFDEIDRTGNAEEALNFILAGGRMALKQNNPFESEVDKVRAEVANFVNGGIAMSNGSIMLPNGNIVTQATLTKIDDELDNLNLVRKKMSELMYQNRNSSRIGEYNYGNLTAAEKARIIELQTDINGLRKSLRTELMVSFDMDINDLLSGDVVRELNDTYYNARRDSINAGGTEFKFNLQNMTVSNAKLMDKIYRYMDSIYTQGVAGRRLSKTTRDNMAKRLNFTYQTAADFDNELRLAIQREGSVDAAMGIYSREYLLPYFYRYSPSGYDEFMRSIKNNTSHDGSLQGNEVIKQLIKDYQNGISSQDSIARYGMDINKFDITLNSRWYEDQTNGMASYENPNFDKEGKYGRFQPKSDLYLDRDYISKYGIQQKTDANGNLYYDDVATRNKDSFDMLTRLRGINSTILDKYGVTGRYSQNRRQQISKGSIDRLKTGATNPFEMLANAVRDVTMNRVDDPLYGQSEDDSLEPSDRDKKVLRKYYLEDLEEESDISDDAIYATMLASYKAALYEARRDALDDIDGLEQILKNQEFKGGKDIKQTNTYEMFKEAIDANVYDVKVNHRRIVVNVLGYPLDVTKLVIGFNRFVEWTNLAHNPMIATTAAVTGQLSMGMEVMVGQYMNRNSTAYALSEIRKLAPEAIGNWGKVGRGDKLYVLGEKVGIYSFSDRAHSASYNRMFRVLDNLGFKMMEILNAPLEPTIMISMMDNYRLINGEFYTYNDFKHMMSQTAGTPVEDSVAKTEWDKHRQTSIYNLVDVVNGKVVAKDPTLADVIDNGMKSIAASIRSVSEICDGTLNEEDQVYARRHWLGRFVMGHRGWFVLALERAYSKKHYNARRMQVEEGYMQTLGNFMKNNARFISEKGFSQILKGLKENYMGMEDYEKANMRRVLVDTLVVATMSFVLKFLINGWGDDDDDDEKSWLEQQSLYLLARTANEMYSRMPTGVELNITEFLESPFIAARTIKDLADPANYTMEKVKSGNYKGQPRFVRTLIKNTPVKNLFTNQDAKAVQKTRQSFMFYNPFFSIFNLTDPTEEERQAAKQGKQGQSPYKISKNPYNNSGKSPYKATEGSPYIQQGK